MFQQCLLNCRCCCAGKLHNVEQPQARHLTHISEILKSEPPPIASSCHLHGPRCTSWYSLFAPCLHRVKSARLFVLVSDPVQRCQMVCVQQCIALFHVFALARLHTTGAMWAVRVPTDCPVFSRPLHDLPQLHCECFVLLSPSAVQPWHCMPLLWYVTRSRAGQLMCSPGNQQHVSKTVLCRPSHRHC